MAGSSVGSAVDDPSPMLAGRDVPGQPEILGAVARAVAPHDLIVAAAGSLPGDLQKLWRPSDPLGYHVEYAFSCMGYEIAGGLGAKRGLVADGELSVRVALAGTVIDGAAFSDGAGGDEHTYIFEDVQDAAHFYRAVIRPADAD